MAYRPRATEPIHLFERAPKVGISPRWMWCHANEYINFWLPKFDRHELPRPSAEQLAAIDKCMLSEDERN